MGIFLAVTNNDLGVEAQKALEEAEQKTNVFFEYLKNHIPDAIQFLQSILFALLVYFIGKRLIKWMLKILDRSFEKGKMDESVANFLHSLCKCGMYVLLVFMIAGILGVGTSSIVALLGSAGLAVGLALQGSLSNFAGGVLILLMKPYGIGDVIQVMGETGTVVSIDIFYTKLRTADNRVVVIPNGTLSNSNITNITANPYRMLELEAPIDYGDDIQKVKELLQDLAKDDERVVSEDENMPMQVFVSRFDASAITMGLRVWVEAGNYLAVKWDLLEKIKLAFDAQGISIPFDRLDVQLVGREEEG